MDQKRLFLAIAISVAILLGFQFLMPHPAVPPPSQTASQSTPAKPGSGEPGAAGPAKPTVAANTVPKNCATRDRSMHRAWLGSISLLGARIDDLELKDYRETLAPDSPLVRLLEPRSEAEPYYAQYGWTAPAGVSVKLPGDDTVWSASAPELAVGKPVTLSWDNGAGLTFEIVLSIDENYMFSVDQRVKNASGEPMSLFPWARIRRDYTPQVAGYYVLFEGLLGVVDGTLQETTYAKTKSDGDKKGGIAYDATAAGGWAGMTDKYWLTAVVPDQAVASTVNFRHIEADGDHYQVDYVTQGSAERRAGRDRERCRRICLPAPRWCGCWIITRVSTRSPASTRRWISAGSTS